MRDTAGSAAAPAARRRNRRRGSFMAPTPLRPFHGRIAHLSNGKRSLHCGISIPPMSEVGLGCVKTPTLPARVEKSRRDCASGKSNLTAHRQLDARVGELYFIHFADV